MSEPVRVAVIGAGGIAEAHLYAWSREPERAKIVALADVDEARAKAVAERFGVPDVVTDYHELLSRDDVDAVSICTPPHIHVPISVEALSAGKNVLCEKPVSPAPAGIDEIEAAQKASGKVFSGVFQLRFGRGAQQVRALLDEGKFGRLHLGVAETLWARDDAYYGVPWRGAWATECGGVTVSQAIHVIDAMVWFLGEPRTVFAQAGTFRAPIESDDTAAAIIRFANGAIGQITSTVTAFGEERSRLEVYGTRLSAVSAGSAYDSTSEPFKLGCSKPEEVATLVADIDERFPRGYKMLHRGQVNDFIEAIEGKHPPLAGIDACRTAVHVTAGIYKSAMSGQPVALPLAKDDPFYSALPPEGYAFPAVDSGERRD